MADLIEKVAVAGITAGMARGRAQLDWYTDQVGPDFERVHKLQLRITDAALARLTARQRHDLVAGYRLLRSAMLPDSFFDGHPASDPETADSVMERIAIVGALDELQALPEIAHPR